MLTACKKRDGFIYAAGLDLLAVDLLSFNCFENESKSA